ncbi:MAG: lysylphosphatidylglycerol synthase transmembrane domain-containing protein [Anaerolineales bacterium]
MKLSPDFFSRKNIIRVIGTLLSIALLIYLLSQQGWGEIVDILCQIPPISLALVVILMAISRISVGARWYSLLRSTTSNISFTESLRMTFAGLFAANFLPTTIGGDVVRLAGALPRSEDRVGSAASIAADRLVGLSGMAMAIPLGLGVLIEWIQTNAVGDIQFLHFVRNAGFTIALAVSGSELWNKIRKIIRGLIDVFVMWIRRPRALITAFGFTWLHMACLFSLLWLLFRGMGQTISFPMVAGLWSFTYLITLMPFSINGLGIREVSISYIFTNLGGVSIQSALALALILRTLEMIASVPGAFFLPAILSSADRGGETGVEADPSP